MRELRAIAPIVAWALLGLLAGAAAAADVEAELLEATRTILCDCGCHPQSVKECACGRAAEMRAEMRALVEGGMTGEQVIAKYVAEKGDQIRIAPTASGFNLLAWLGPLVALVLAVGGTLWLARRWSGARADEAPVPAPALEAADPYVDRLRREITERE